jgi:hypothetical protein
LAVAAVVIAMPSISRAESGTLTGLCNYFAGRVIELERAGERAKARSMRPQLVKCIGLLKDQQLRDAKRFMKRYDDALDWSKGEKI